MPHFLLAQQSGTFLGVPLAKELVRTFDFGWKDAAILILLLLLGLMVQFHVFWHEEQEKQAKP